METMTRDEIVTALGYCAVSNCEECNGAEYGDKMCCCSDALKLSAADLIENQQNHIRALLQANDALRERQRWIPVTERLPVGADQVLVVASGKPRENIELVHAIEIASLCSDGWCLETWPEWTGAAVTHWMPLPEALEVE